ncbi:MATE family efflux transporter [Phaeodactylibacter luteus]|uniref:MATE family efflux transporter n=1 Tax=Phaeodactylibacter luteus TaxID=1564516 RepID=A0A5C6RII5_9BACT|nr:MATE family efflux transporter [Phaeodactylibacter luteus]
MLGSAAQNVVALSDSVFLFHLSEEDFAAIGFVGVFYLVIAAIGYGFSRGGQIMIARRAGERELTEVGRTFYAMVYFEAALALLMFLFMQYGCYYFFGLFVNSEVIFEKSLAYLSTRSWGVFFSYVGVAVIALYTGLARTSFIIVDTIILGAVNIALNYGLIFGHWGLPAMGIAGAGLASTIAEVVAFAVFLVYIFFDKKARAYRLFRLPDIDLALIRQQYKLALPIVAQSFVGLGSWFVFFGIVENLGERELAITNLVRMVYLILSIPTWGFASGVNTMVSNFIGQRKRQAVLPIIWKTAKLSWLTTMLIALPVVLFPHELLYPLLGGEDMSLISAAQPVFYVLVGILTAFSVGSIYFNGMAGTGATFYGLIIQTVSAVVYLGYIYSVVNYTDWGLPWAWASEILYWVVMMAAIFWYLRSRHWHGLEV